MPRHYFERLEEHIPVGYTRHVGWMSVPHPTINPWTGKKYDMDICTVTIMGNDREELTFLGGFLAKKLLDAGVSTVLCDISPCYGIEATLPDFQVAEIPPAIERE